MNPRPTDKARAARTILGIIDGDQDKAAQPIQEAINEGTTVDLINALVGFNIGFLRLIAKDNRGHMREWCDQQILKAQLDDEAGST